MSLTPHILPCYLYSQITAPLNRSQYLALDKCVSFCFDLKLVNVLNTSFLPHDARSASAVLLSYVVVPSVRLSVCDVAVSLAHRLN